ncbi:39S ribosomal protein L46, mitochondrial [Fopius arisanus]|uniref:Large ribosomal subunit protein mL46 n=1 Tax=Fopius arisanus TaxID=64838 RepID=A0A0C9RD06_9HYME|nr:PREDICTED: 39S ribosomal protein L46, mitochondrial [Fopius arisanus]
MLFKQSWKLYTINYSTNLIPHILRCHNRARCSGPSEKWDLMAAVCVERHPVITKPKTELEEKVLDVLLQIESENSLKNDHELRAELETKQNELFKKGMEIDPDKVLTITAQDIEDAGEAELAKFPFASRITDADKENIKNSLERRLDKCLVLLVNQKVGTDTFWLPPQGLREDGESLRQTAERILQTTCGPAFSAKIYGNAPMGFYKYVYPKAVREKGSRGVKIFYYLAKYISGNLEDPVKYQWLDRKELGSILPKPVHRSVSMFLVPE